MPPDEPVTISLQEAQQAEADWETQLTSLLQDLSATQGELLDLLARKRSMLVAGDREGLSGIGPEEQRLAQQLLQCQQRRQELLDRASSQGLPQQNLQLLAEALPEPARRNLRPAIREARSRARMVQHQSLTNWVLAQRSLLHLAQLIEIVATGGEKPPTYQKEGPTPTGGVLMDRAV